MYIRLYIYVCYIWPGHIPAYFVDLRPQGSRTGFPHPTAAQRPSIKCFMASSSGECSTAKHQVLHGFIVGGMHLSGIRWSKFPGLTGSSTTK